MATIKEAIKKRNSEVIDESLMIWTVQEYIKIRKERDVKIKIRRIHQMNVFSGTISNPDIDKLTYAYCHAVGWFKDNGYEVE